MVHRVFKLLHIKLYPKVVIVVKSAFSEKYLFCTNMLISGGLSAVGDVIEQNYEMATDKLEQLNKTRTFNMSAYGITMGAFCHHWYKFLDKRYPATSVGIVMKKVIIDQVVASPICISLCFIMIGVLENTPRDEVIEEMKQKAWKLYAAECVIWPPMQFVNFYCLSTKFRVLYDNIISLGYDIFISYVKYNTPVKSKKD